MNRKLEIKLNVRDPEVMAEMLKHPEGEERERYALTALRLGVMSLRMASGQVDAAAIKEAGKEIVHQLGDVLTNRAVDIDKSLAKYFDPESGRMQERIESFVKKDGELERMLRDHLGPEESLIARTLAIHLGENSPVLKMLSPTDSQGLKTQLETVVKEALEDQREKLLNQFSLDIKDSAMSRLKLELDESLSKQKMANEAFHQEVHDTLATYRIRKDESEKSTRHGAVFEEQLGSLLSMEAQRLGDVFESTGNRTGTIKNCKVGDYVIELGPESAAPGACLVWEAKEDRSYNLKKALDEMEVARKNRSAQLGVFVFSASTAPQEMEPFARYGNDLVIIWDAEDETTDLRLKAAYSVARALGVKQVGQSGRDVGDSIDRIESATRAVEKQVKYLDEFEKWSGTIKSHAEKILDRSERMRTDLAKEVLALDQQIAVLKTK